MSVTRQDYWNVVPRLQDEINRLFGNVRENDSSSATAAWIPLVDIHEYTNRFELYVDLPGVDPSSVDLTLDGGVLTLSGNRPAQLFAKPGEDAQARRTERVTAGSTGGSCCRIRRTARRSTPRARTAF